MWVVRDCLMGDIEERLDSFEIAVTVAKAVSKQVRQSLEVLNVETNQVVAMFLEGRELWDCKQDNSVCVSHSDHMAKQHGRLIWEDLADRREWLNRLRKKLKLTSFEQRQAPLIQRGVEDREAQLASILSVNEYQCTYYKFLVHRYKDIYVPFQVNYCDRQIRRYVTLALKKTGMTAQAEGWTPIARQRVTETYNGHVSAHDRIHSLI